MPMAALMAPDWDPERDPELVLVDVSHESTPAGRPVMMDVLPLFFRVGMGPGFPPVRRLLKLDCLERPPPPAPAG